MGLLMLLAPQAVALDVVASSKKQALEKAAEVLQRSTGADVREIANALQAREKEGTTGFGGGTAIPHGRVPGLSKIHACLLRLNQPVDWQAVDGLPVDIVVAMVGPEEAGTDHLKALALVSRTLRDKPFVEKLRGAKDDAALWALVSAGEKVAV